jgi:hypothetical protein
MTKIKVGDVFVPGRLPQHTYVARNELALERHIQDYLDEKGDILTIAGPTKTGKSVLLRKVLTDPIWLEGANIGSAEDFWRGVGDKLGIFTEIGRSSNESHQVSGGIGASLGVPKVFTISADGKYAYTDTDGSTASVSRPIADVCSAALTAADRTVVIDDFHYIERPVQTAIVRSFKPLVFDDSTIIFISTSHRTKDVVSSERDMGSRARLIEVKLWSAQSLIKIAELGFALLNVKDPGGRIAERLAKSSFGSPHLMQRFCRELCKSNEIYENRAIAVNLQEPPSWPTFFSTMIEKVPKDWGHKLLAGPKVHGQPRLIWNLKDGRAVDHYGLILAAITSTGPKLALTRDELKVAMDELVAGAGPTNDRTTKVLKQMSEIASRRLTEPQASEEDIDQEAESSDHHDDVQPVLEYVDDDANSALYIADPLFAFYLAYNEHEAAVASESADISVRVGH